MFNRLRGISSFSFLSFFAFASLNCQFSWRPKTACLNNRPKGRKPIKCLRCLIKCWKTAFQLGLQCFGSHVHFYYKWPCWAKTLQTDRLLSSYFGWVCRQSPIVANGRVETNTADRLAISFPRVSHKCGVQVGNFFHLIGNQIIQNNDSNNGKNYEYRIQLSARPMSRWVDESRKEIYTGFGN